MRSRCRRQPSGGALPPIAHGNSIPSGSVASIARIVGLDARRHRRTKGHMQCWGAWREKSRRRAFRPWKPNSPRSDITLFSQKQKKTRQRELELEKHGTRTASSTLALFVGEKSEVILIDAPAAETCCMQGKLHQVRCRRPPIQARPPTASPIHPHLSYLTREPHRISRPTEQ